MNTLLVRVRGWQRSAILFFVGAIVIGTFGLALPARAQPPSRDPDMRILVVDLAAELRLVYRNNVPEFTRRHEQLREAITAWNASSKSAADRQQMTAWLREAIRNSMPGAEKPMPAVPTFDSRSADAPASQRNIVVEKPIVPPATAEKAAVRDESLTSKLIPAETSPQVDNGLNWAEHPAASELPPELRDGDPFRDDPPAATAQP